MTPLVKHAPRNWSVSQVDNYLDCARKHFFKSVLKLPDPSNEAAQRGTSIHKAVENTSAQLADGAQLEEALDAHSPVDAPWMRYVRALAQADALPHPGEPHVREHRFSIPTHTGIPFIGLIDQILDERTPIDLTDFKSTSDIRYAKTPLELSTNLQLNAYAYYIFQHVPDDIVRARLVYVEAKKIPPKKKLPRVVNVHVDLDRTNVSRIWNGDVPFGDQTKGLFLPKVLDDMLRTATETEDFNDITPTTTSCTKYGGCPYRTQCGLSPFVGLRKDNTKMAGFLSKTNGAAKPNGEAPPPASTTPPKTASTGFLARAKASGETPTPRPTEEERQAKLDKDFGPAAVPTGIVPPDAPSRMTPLETKTEAEPEVEAPAVEEPAKKRGRPKKETSEGTEVEAGSVAKKSQRREFVLMIDCAVTKGAGGVEPTHLDDFFSTIELELNEFAAATEEKLSSYWLLPFASQKAALSSKVQERIAKGLPPVMVVRSSSPAAREVLPMLIPFATQIIQSIRG